MVQKLDFDKKKIALKLLRVSILVPNKMASSLPTGNKLVMKQITPQPMPYKFEIIQLLLMTGYSTTV